MNRGPQSTKCSAFIVLGRLHRIAERFYSKEIVTAGELAAQEEVCNKTIYRSLDFLRDQLGWVFENTGSGLRLVKPGKTLIRNCRRQPPPRRSGALARRGESDS